MTDSNYIAYKEWLKHRRLNSSLNPLLQDEKSKLIKEKYIIDQTPITFKELIKESKKRSIFSKCIAPYKITSDLLVDRHKEK